MTPEQVKQIAQQVAQQVYIQMSTRDQFKVSNTPIHSHTGLDSPQVNSSNVVGFSTLSNDTGSMLAKNNSHGGGTYSQQTSGNTTVFTIPVVSYGMGGGFNGGTAPDGTVLLATGGSYITTQLWVLSDGTWYGFASNQSTPE